MKIIKKLVLILFAAVLIYALFTARAYIEYKKGYKDCKNIYAGQISGATPSPEELCEQGNKILKWKITHPFGNYFDYYSPLM